MELRKYIKEELVRDGIVADVKRRGGETEHEILTGAQKTRSQLEKMVKEAQELLESFIQTGRISLKELVDVSEIRRQVVEESGFTAEEVEDARQERWLEMGGFAGGWFLKTIAVPEGSEWDEYFAADPERFPEVE